MMKVYVIVSVSFKEHYVCLGGGLGTEGAHDMIKLC
jgi:hypothetical protein